MSLNVGTLFGQLQLDTRQWTRNLSNAFKAGDRMVAEARATYSRGGQQAGQGFADGVSRQMRGVRSQMAQAGDQAGKGFASKVTAAVGGVAASFGREGVRSGGEFSASVRKGLDPAGMWRDVNGRLHDQTGRFAKAGKAAGDEYQKGVEKGTDGLGDRLSARVDSAVNGIGPKLANLAAGVGAAIGAALTAAFLQALEFERAADLLTAQLGVGGPRAKQLGKIAGDLYAAGLGDSLGDVAAAIRALFANDVIPADAIGADIRQVTSDFMNLTTVMEQDVGMTAQAVGQLMRNGLAKDATEAMDILTVAIQEGADRAGDLMETVQEYAPQWAKMGLSGQQALGLIIQGLNAGARDADTVADAMKELTIRSQEALFTIEEKADTSAQALKRLSSAQRGVEMAERGLEDQVRNSLRAQKALTDARAEAQQQLKDLADQVDDASRDTERSAIAVERAQERLNDVMANKDASELDRREARLALEEAKQSLGDQQKKVLELQDAKRKADAAGVDGSEQVINAFFGVLDAQQGVEDATRSVADATAEQRDAQIELANSYGYTRKILTPLGQALRDLGIDGEEFQRKIAQGGRVAEDAYGDLMNKLMAVEDPIKQAQLGVVLLGTKWEDLQNAANDFKWDEAGKEFENAEGSVKQLGTAFENTLSNWELFKRQSLQKLGEWDTAVAEIVTQVVFGLISAISRFVDWAPEAFARAGNAISAAWSTAWRTVKDIFGGVWNWLTSIPGRIWNALGYMWAIIYGTFSSAWDTVKATFESAWGWITGLPGRIWGATRGMWAGFTDSFKAALNAIVDMWNSLGWKLPTIDLGPLGKFGGWQVGPKYQEALRLPRFHQGTGPLGVPGRPGEEVVAKLLAGETVRTVPQERALQRNLAGLASIAAAGLAGATGQATGASGSSSYVTHFNQTLQMHGPVARDSVRWVKQQIAEGTRTGIVTARDLPGRRG